MTDGFPSVEIPDCTVRKLRMERPPAIVIGYDPRYLLDAFDAFAKRGIKTARMSFTSPVGPTVLTADNGFTELILPVRLKPEEATTYIPPRKTGGITQNKKLEVAHHENLVCSQRENTAL